MKLTFLGNTYEAETTVSLNGIPTTLTGKYRGTPFTTTSTCVPPTSNCQRKYRGISY